MSFHVDQIQHRLWGERLARRGARQQRAPDPARADPGLPGRARRARCAAAGLSGDTAAGAAIAGRCTGRGPRGGGHGPAAGTGRNAATAATRPAAGRGAAAPAHRGATPGRGAAGCWQRVVTGTTTCAGVHPPERDRPG
ncbi:hypothetical protein G6F22_018140 [Rhizopus arrhizus]|nr:hypothetical protein G6F22_018140 [Rhizopus arrhizus]